MPSTIARRLRPVDVLGTSDPVVGPVDSPRYGGVARILWPHDPEPLELVHEPARAVEPDLELGLHHRGARLARLRHELGRAWRQLVLGEAREPAELAAILAVAVVGAREDRLVVVRH